jgi:hypothetical protein
MRAVFRMKVEAIHQATRARPSMGLEGIRVELG